MNPIHPEGGETRTVKRCGDCQETKTPDEFYNSRHAPDGKQSRCKTCQSVYHRDPERVARRREYGWQSCLKLKGIAEERYWEQYERQGGVCAICGTRESHRKLAIDHDHSCCPGAKACGECFRGLLCGNCNRGLGQLGDDPERVEAALLYLRAKIGEPIQQHD